MKKLGFAVSRVERTIDEVEEAHGGWGIDSRQDCLNAGSGILDIRVSTA